MSHRHLNMGPMPPMAPMGPMTPMAPMAPMGPVPGDSTTNSSSTMNMKEMGMHMSLFWGKDVIILFQGWPNNHLGMYILALIFVFFLSFAVEILSIYNPSSSSSSSKLNNPVVSSLIHTVGYTAKTALSYLVMLSVMSFNIGIFIAAVIGHALGGFLVKYHSLTNQQMPSRTEPPFIALTKPPSESSA